MYASSAWIRANTRKDLVYMTTVVLTGTTLTVLPRDVAGLYPIVLEIANKD
jgi:hypothetical protein